MRALIKLFLVGALIKQNLFIRAPTVSPDVGVLIKKKKERRRRQRKSPPKVNQIQAQS